MNLPCLTVFRLWGQCLRYGLISGRTAAQKSLCIGYPKWGCGARQRCCRIPSCMRLIRCLEEIRTMCPANLASSRPHTPACTLPDPSRWPSSPPGHCLLQRDRPASRIRRRSERMPRRETWSSRIPGRGVRSRSCFPADVAQTACPMVSPPSRCLVCLDDTTKSGRSGRMGRDKSCLSARMEGQSGVRLRPTGPAHHTASPPRCAGNSTGCAGWGHRCGGLPPDRGGRSTAARRSRWGLG